MKRLRKAAENIGKVRELAAQRQETHKRVRNLNIFGSQVTFLFICLDKRSVQVGDVRPVAWTSFSPDSKYVCTAGWSGERLMERLLIRSLLSTGLCAVWTVPECRRQRNLRAHTAPASCIRFAPQASKAVNSELTLASCGHDGAVFLWDGER